MSRDSQRTVQSESDISDAGRTLLLELQALKDRSGLDLRGIESRTFASRSSWGRWLKGDSRIPLDAVEALADLCGGDRRRLRALWELAETDRRQVPKEAEKERAVPAEAVAMPPAPDAQDAEPKAVSAWSTRMRAGMTFVYIAVAGVLGVAIGLYFREPPAPPPVPSSDQTQWVPRSDVVARAQGWHPHTAQRIPYAQDRTVAGYRTDGSGYAAMILGLPKPGPISTVLASGDYTRRIPAAELLSGDLIIREVGGVGVREVIVFDRWTDSGHTAYWAYQQRRNYGTDHLLLDRGLKGGDGYFTYRPLNVREESSGGGSRAGARDAARLPS